MGILDPQPGADIGYWLARKYALLQQNANADTERAAAGTTAANAAAALDTARAGVVAPDSAAQRALQGAQTDNLLTTTKTILPESRARIRASDAGSVFNNIQSGALYRKAFTAQGAPIGNAPSFGALSSGVFGGGALPGMGGSPLYRLPSGGVDETRRPGETEAAYMDRINGL